MSIQRILAVSLGNEQDVVLVRQRARQVPHLLGFSHQDQVRIDRKSTRLNSSH